MRRDLFTEDHEAFRGLAHDFVEKEVIPHYPEWEKGGRMPREVFKQMGALGMLGMAIPEEYGGAGMPDYRYNVVMQEEAARALVTLSTVRTQLDYGIGLVQEIAETGKLEATLAKLVKIAPDLADEDIDAVAEVSFDLQAGEVVGFIGPNGAGKTTVLDIISGFVMPDRGRVVVDGNDERGIEVGVMSTQSAHHTKALGWRSNR